MALTGTSAKKESAVYNAFYTFGPPASLRLYFLFPFHFQNILVGNGCAEYSAVFPAGVCVRARVYWGLSNAEVQSLVGR